MISCVHGPLPGLGAEDPLNSNETGQSWDVKKDGGTALGEEKQLGRNTGKNHMFFFFSGYFLVTVPWNRHKLTHKKLVQVFLNVSKHQPMFYRKSKTRVNQTSPKSNTLSTSKIFKHPWLKRLKSHAPGPPLARAGRACAQLGRWGLHQRKHRSGKTSEFQVGWWIFMILGDFWWTTLVIFS